MWLVEKREGGINVYYPPENKRTHKSHTYIQIYLKQRNQTMACCFNVVCFFCTLCVFIGLASLVQLSLGIYLTFIQTDIVTINQLVKTDKFDSYLFYILLIFIGLGLISLALSFFSIYSAVRRLKSLSLFVSVLWVSLLKLVVVFSKFSFLST
jgi:hypothetical protein